MGRLAGSKDKIHRLYVYSFARQFLDDHKISVYCGDEQILLPVPHKDQLYKIKLPKTGFHVGQEFETSGEVRKISSYESLHDLGWTFLSVPVKNGERWHFQQKVRYILKRIGETGQPMNYIPKNHYVQFDTQNKALRIVGRGGGPLGFSDWYLMERADRKGIGGRQSSWDTLLENPEQFLKKKYQTWSGEESKPEFVRIREAAVMITNAGEIICIPYDSKDMPTILIVGKKRSGKSYCFHRLVDSFFWKPEYNYHMAVLNDSSSEMDTWVLPNSDTKQVRTLNGINEQPLPLPCVYFHPTIKDSNHNKYYMNDVGFDITIPWREVIDKYDEYLDLGKSKRYFQKVAEFLRGCKDEDAVRTIIDELAFDQKKYGVPGQTAGKIYAEIDTILKNKMTDISNPGHMPWRTSLIPDKKYNPFTAAVSAGVLPILETAQVSSSTNMLSTYVRYFMNDLFDRQVLDKEFVKRKPEILLCADEIHNLAEKGKKAYTPASMLLARCVREGGPRRVGTLLSTQMFNRVPDVIKDNSTYIFCFNNPGEAVDIASQYNMGKDFANRIKTLEKHHCLAYTSEKFIVYDSSGNRRESKINEVFVGKVLPTLSTHKKPIDKKNSKDSGDEDDDETDDE